MLEKVTVRNKEKRTPIAAIGATMIIFSIVGIISTAAWLISGADWLLSKQWQIDEFERVVYPLVMVDAPVTDKTSKLDNSILLQASLYYCLMNEDETKYEDITQGGLVVPASDLEKYAVLLFGVGTTVEHATVGQGSNIYTYDEETNSYYVPLSTTVDTYTPTIVSSYQDGSFYYVRVGYLSSTDIWSIDLYGNEEEPEPDKYVVYVLQKVGDSYCVYSINQDTEE